MVNTKAVNGNLEAVNTPDNKVTPDTTPSALSRPSRLPMNWLSLRKWRAELEHRSMRQTATTHYRQRTLTLTIKRCRFPDCII